LHSKNRSRTTARADAPLFRVGLQLGGVIADGDDLLAGPPVIDPATGLPDFIQSPAFPS